jgi:hypothetical protein
LYTLWFSPLNIHAIKHNKELTMATVAYRSEKSPQHPHIEWIELAKDGILHECAVMKRDPSGNLFFFKTNSLDNIDRQRLAGILADRNVNAFELWDLMSQRTLGNGMNALAYFHQLVRVLTPQGKVIDPRQGQIGVASIPTGTVNTGTPAA